MQHLEQALNVGEHVPVAELHGLRRAGGSRREEHGGGLPRGCLGRHAARQGPGRKHGQGTGHEAIPTCDRTAQGGKGMPLNSLCSVHFVSDPRLSSRLLHQRRTLPCRQRRIDGDRHPVAQDKGEIHDRILDTRLQVHRHTPRLTQSSVERAAQGHGLHQELAVGDAALGIHQRRAAAVELGADHKAPGQRARPTVALGATRGDGLLDGIAHLARGRVGRQGLSDHHVHRIGQAVRPLPEEAAALEAEDAAPQAVEANGDDGHVGPARDDLQPLGEGQHGAGAGDAALREDADEGSIARRLSRFVQGVLLLLGRIPRADGNETHAAAEGPHHGEVQVVPVHQEPRRALGHGPHEHAVHEGHVIGHQEGATLFGEVLPTTDPQAIESVRQGQEYQAHEELPRQHEGGNAPQGHDDAPHHEHLWRVQGQALIPEDEHGGGQQDPHKVHHLRQALHGATLLLARQALDQAAHGNGEDPRKRPHAQETEAHPGRTARCKGGGQQARGHAQEAQWNQAALNAIPRDAAGDHRPNDDAQARHGREHAGVGVRQAHPAPVGGDDDQEGGRHQVEEAAGDDGEDQVALALGGAPMRDQFRYRVPVDAPLGVHRGQGFDAQGAQPADGGEAHVPETRHP